jgi:hypothetical protein
MHLLIILQTAIECSMWWLFVVITFLSKILNQIALLADFFSLLISDWESSTPLEEISSLRKIVGSLPEALPEILLFETLPSYRFGLAIPILFVGMAHLCQPWARVNVYFATFNSTRDCHVAIDQFQWPLLSRYLLGLYLAPHSMGSPRASALTLCWPSRSTSLWL